MNSPTPLEPHRIDLRDAPDVRVTLEQRPDVQAMQLTVEVRHTETRRLEILFDTSTTALPDTLANLEKIAAAYFPDALELPGYFNFFRETILKEIQRLIRSVCIAHFRLR